MNKHEDCISIAPAHPLLPWPDSHSVLRRALLELENAAGEELGDIVMIPSRPDTGNDPVIGEIQAMESVPGLGRLVEESALNSHCNDTMLRELDELEGLAASALLDGMTAGQTAQLIGMIKAAS